MRRLGSKSGFTLIELILVLALMAIIVAMVAPSLRGFSVGRKSKYAATQFVVLTRYARTQAATEARIYRVNFDTAGNGYFLTVDDGSGTYAAPPTEQGKKFTLADGVRLELTQVDTKQDGTYLEFKPNGISDTGHVKFVNEFGDATDVVCEAATEYFKVIDPREANP